MYTHCNSLRNKKEEKITIGNSNPIIAWSDYLYILIAQARLVFSLCYYLFLWFKKGRILVNIIFIVKMRKLKFHEQKLLKKVDLYNWKSEKDHREVRVMRRYHVQSREDYDK